MKKKRSLQETDIAIQLSCGKKAMAVFGKNGVLAKQVFAIQAMLSGWRR